MAEGCLRLIVLKELLRTPSTGYTLMKRVGAVTGMKPSPGSMYPLLQSLTKNGFIKAESKGRKKVYTITKEGRASLGKLFREKEETMLMNLDLVELYDRVAGTKESAALHATLQKNGVERQTMLEVNKSVKELRSFALGIISGAGKPTQKKRVLAVLAKARRDLEVMKL